MLTEYFCHTCKRIHKGEPALVKVSEGYKIPTRKYCKIALEGKSFKESGGRSPHTDYYEYLGKTYR